MSGHFPTRPRTALARVKALSVARVILFLRGLLLGISFLGFFVSSLIAQIGFSTSKFKEGELLVKWEGGPGLNSAALLNASLGSRVLQNFSQSGWQHIQLRKGVSIQQGLINYRQLRQVLAVEPNYVRRLYSLPGDPMVGQQWALNRISAPAAWNITRGDTNVVVAVIDSGINYDHEDLRANMWRNPGEIPGNGIDDDGNGYVDDVYGIAPANHNSDPKDDYLHGTACAGIIGAAGDNGLGGTGINWAVQIMALKSHGSNGNGYDADIIECFEYVIMMKKRGINIRVTSNSYGGNESGQAIKDAIDAAGNAGILNVWAAGNDHSDNDLVPRYPQSFNSPSILSVAASDEADGLASFSNFGMRTVDIAAPGQNIFTTDFTGPSAYRMRFTGTSAACPFVAGAAALICSISPGLNPMQLKSALLSSADFLPSLAGRVSSNGRLNVARALLNISSDDAPPLVLEVAPTGNRILRSAPIEITFSQPMDSDSVEQGLTIEPPLEGVFEWSNGNRTCAFIPNFLLEAGTNYTLRLSATAHNLNGKGLDGNGNRQPDPGTADNFTWSFRVPPLNDDWSNARSISDFAGVAYASNVNATYEPGEPKPAGSWGGASIWFRWVAPASGSFTFTTMGSDIETLLAVYEGDALRTLNRLFVDNSCMDGSSSRATFLARQGTAYSLALDGKTYRDYMRDAPPMGAIQLNWFQTSGPIIEELDRWEARPGERVNIYGHNFLGVTNVTVGETSVPFTNKTDVVIRITIPDRLPEGVLTVMTPAGTGASVSNLVILPPLPILSIERFGSNRVRIKWPETGFGFRVQASTKATAQKLWNENQTQSSGQELILTNDLSIPESYFRMIK